MVSNLFPLKKQICIYSVETISIRLIDVGFIYIYVYEFDS